MRAALQNDDFHRSGCTCGDAGCLARSPDHRVNFREDDCCVCNAEAAELQGVLA